MNRQQKKQPANNYTFDKKQFLKDLVDFDQKETKINVEIDNTVELRQEETSKAI